MKKQSQNKANLLDAQMNVSSILTKDYENVPLRRRGENKPNQTQSPSPRFYPKNTTSPKNNLKKPYFPPFYRLPVLIQWKKQGRLNARTQSEASPAKI